MQSHSGNAQIRRILNYIAILFIVWIVLCSAGLVVLAYFGVGKTLSVVSLTDADTGKTFAVSQTGSITINLKENPTTGYTWNFVQQGDGALNLLSSNYIPDTGGGIGGGGVHTFIFKGEKAGLVKLLFTSRRTWEKDNPPAVQEDFSFQLR